MQTIEEKFSLIFNHMGLPADQIRHEASFAHDFHFGDLQFTCLAFYIGIFFKINVRETDYAQINTVGEAIDFVKRKLNFN